MRVLAKGASVLLRILAWACRVLAILFAFACIALCFGPIGALTPIADLTFALQSLIPKALAGIFVWISPLGGSFRGDFAIASVALFLLDWALVRASTALR